VNRIDRLHAILTHLQSKKRVTAEEIADRFGISPRTVYRDIKALEGSGIPIIGEAGIGYSVMEGYRLPPVMFTQEEASALLLGSKLAEQFTDDSIRQHFSSALYKIKSVLRTSDKEYVDNLTTNIEIMRARVPAEELAQQYLSSLQRAIAERRVVSMEYYAQYKDEVMQRVIEPIGLCYYGSAWHVIGWCRLRNDYRDFRLGRIRKMSLGEETFSENTHPSIQEYIRQVTDRSELLEVTIRFNKTVARHIGEQKYFYGFVSQEDVDEYVQMKFVTAQLELFGRWLLMFTNAVTIVAPETLRETMMRLVTNLQDHHQ
jgi:predicted DNA-binding transcriptional regulator YafY